MKRHPALVPLSHDHHHALVEARRLRRAADTPESAAAATAFLRFFADQTVRHFREEEELLFPRVLEFEEARELLVQALLEHQRLHALTAQLQQSVSAGGEIEDLMRELGELLEAHVRLEERRLFPLIERLLEDVTELQPRLRDGLEADAPEQSPVTAERLASDELNVTPLSWKAGSGPPEHVNEERDVLVVVLDGSATLGIDGEERELARGDTAIIAKGRRRKITAGRGGVRYLSIHRRRPPLQIGRAAERGDVHGEKTEGGLCGLCDSMVSVALAP
jgi:quercetin dioxygenase-like cupin family protein/iron-sulfur cluster repair protein YtfE (RIC family)